MESETATHSSILAWRIPWTEEAGRLLSTWSQRVGHDWVNSHTHNIPLYVCTMYPYLSLWRWKFRWLPCLGHHKLCCNESWAPGSFHTVFSSRYTPRAGLLDHTVALFFFLISFLFNKSGLLPTISGGRKVLSPNMPPYSYNLKWF